MDEIDAAQQRELEANRRRDDLQQEQIERLESNQALMLALMVLNGVAALAQIIECAAVLTRGCK